MSKEFIDKNYLIDSLNKSNIISKDSILEWIEIQPVYDENVIKLKDEIAIKAMVAMIRFGDTNHRDPKYLSNKSYDIADAMMRRRKLNESN